MQRWMKNHSDTTNQSLPALDNRVHKLPTRVFIHRVNYLEELKAGLTSQGPHSRHPCW